MIERIPDYFPQDVFGHNVDLTKVVRNPTEIFGGSELKSIKMKIGTNLLQHQSQIDRAGLRHGGFS